MTGSRTPNPVSRIRVSCTKGWPPTIGLSRNELSPAFTGAEKTPSFWPCAAAVAVMPPAWFLISPAMSRRKVGVGPFGSFCLVTVPVGVTVLAVNCS